MGKRFQGLVLKENRARTVYVDERGAVVKRFHNPSAVQALRDRRRAQAERRVLEALLARDLPVPRPLEVRRSGGSWEVVMERIQDAVSLAAVLAGEVRPPVPVPALARAVGELLARAHAAGLDHPDLHPGNVLIDPAGRPWLIDFHKARVRASLSRTVLERDLVGLTAALREGLAADARTALLAAWARSSPTQVPEPELKGFLHRIDERARLHRRAYVAHAQGRWTRESSMCRVLERDDGPVYLRRDVGGEVLPEVERQAAGGEGAVVRLGDERAFLLTGLPTAELTERWYAAVRLWEHGLPALRPLLKTGRVAAFGLPPGAREGTLDEASPAALGALVGGLHDRGLDLAALPARLWADGEALLLPPPTRLLHVDPRPGSMSIRRRFAAAAGLGIAGEDAVAFLAAYADAFRCGDTERAALRAELGLG